MPAVVGELCAGVLVGPSVLDHVAPAFAEWLLPKDVAQFHLLDAVGQLGVLLLVGLVGVNVDFALVHRRGLTAARVSAAGSSCGSGSASPLATSCRTPSCRRRLTARSSLCSSGWPCASVSFP